MSWYTAVSLQSSEMVSWRMFNSHVTQMHLKYTGFALAPDLCGSQFSAADKRSAVLYQFKIVCHQKCLP